MECDALLGGESISSTRLQQQKWSACGSAQGGREDHTSHSYEHDRLMFARAGKAILLGSFLITCITLAGCLYPSSLMDQKHKDLHNFMRLSSVFGLASVGASAVMCMVSISNRQITTVVADLRWAMLMASITLVLSLVFVAGAFSTGITILFGGVRRFEC